MYAFTLKEVVTCGEEKILINLGGKWLSENCGKMLMELSFLVQCKIIKCAFITKGRYLHNGSFWKLDTKLFLLF